MGVNEIKKSEMMSGIRQLDIISTVCWGYFSLLPGVENAECLRNSLKKKWQIVYFFFCFITEIVVRRHFCLFLSIFRGCFNESLPSGEKDNQGSS